MKNDWKYIIFAGLIATVISFIIVVDRTEKIETKIIEEVEIDSRPASESPIDETILNKIDSVDINYEKLKKEKIEHLKKEKHINDSIRLINLKFKEEQKKFQEEKKLMKERYEKQIDNIYEYNNVSRGGPEDTLRSEKD